MDRLNFNLPKSTEVRRIIPKTAFFRNAKTGVKTKVKELFTEEIEKIILLNKLHQSTMNIADGAWKEIDIILVKLKPDCHNLADEVLRVMDSAFPRPVLFIVCDGDFVWATISYKEKSPQSTTHRKANFENGIKIVQAFATARARELTLDFSGLSIDMVYTGLIKQISGRNFVGTDLNAAREDMDKAAIETEIQKKIKKLEKEYQKEFSIARRQEIAKEINKMKGAI